MIFTVKYLLRSFLTFLFSACTSAELAVDIIKKQTKKIASETTPSQQKTHKELNQIRFIR